MSVIVLYAVWYNI